MRNVAGLSTSEAQKSTDMFLKCRYMDELTGGRGVIFATGTPISNSMTEMYTMPKSRVEFWQKKFETNIRRDEIVRDELAAKGIRRLIVWECTIRCMKKDKRKEKEMVDAILSFIKGIETTIEF